MKSYLWRCYWSLHLATHHCPIIYHFSFRILFHFSSFFSFLITSTDEGTSISHIVLKAFNPHQYSLFTCISFVLLLQFLPCFYQFLFLLFLLLVHLFLSSVFFYFQAIFHACIFISFRLRCFFIMWLFLWEYFSFTLNLFIHFFILGKKWERWTPMWLLLSFLVLQYSVWIVNVDDKRFKSYVHLNTITFRTCKNYVKKERQRKTIK